jgi:hypothetical protein
MKLHLRWLGTNQKLLSISNSEGVADEQHHDSTRRTFLFKQKHHKPHITFTMAWLQFSEETKVRPPPALQLGIGPPA